MNTLKLIITFAFLYLSGTSCYAGWGISGGMNMNFGQNQNPAPLNIDVKPGLGFMFGGFYNYKFNDQINIRSVGQIRTFRVRNKEAGMNFQLYSLQLATPIVFHHRVYKSFGYFVILMSAVDFK